MNGPARALRLAAASVVIAGGLIVASCGGGSVQTAPVVQPTNAPASTQAVPTTGGSLTAPAAGNGQAATFSFATGVPSGITLTSSSSTTAPGSAPAPSSIVRRAEAISGAVPFFFVTFSFSASLSSSYVTSEAVSLTSSNPTTAQYYVEFDDITSSPGTKLGCAGPGTVAGLVATILNNGSGGVCTTSGSNPSLQTGHTYLAQFYYVAAGTASPTPSPSPSPTATATSGTQAVFPCGTLTNFTTGSPMAYPTLGACSAAITFQSGTTFGAGTSVNVTTSITPPVGAPSPLPSNPSTGTGAPKAALLYEELQVTAGSITVPPGALTSPLQTVTIASTGTCSTYGESFATSAQGWQGASQGTLNGLTVTFPAGQNSSGTTLNVAGSPYFIGYFCY